VKKKKAEELERQLIETERAYCETESDLEKAQAKQSDIWKKRKRRREQMSKDDLRQYKFLKSTRSAEKWARRSEERS
jgi:hypothetical protein